MEAERRERVIEGVTVPRREQEILGLERRQGAGASLTTLMTRS
jgi:hypothetical protein